MIRKTVYNQFIIRLSGMQRRRNKTLQFPITQNEIYFFLKRVKYQHYYYQLPRPHPHNLMDQLRLKSVSFHSCNKNCAQCLPNKTEDKPQCTNIYTDHFIKMEGSSFDSFCFPPREVEIYSFHSYISQIPAFCTLSRTQQVN